MSYGPYPSGQPAYQPGPPVYPSSPPAYQPGPPAYQPGPPAYQPGPPAYQPGPTAYQPGPPMYPPGPPMYPPGPPMYPPPSHLVRNLLIGVLALAVVVAAVLGGLWWQRRSNPNLPSTTFSSQAPTQPVSSSASPSDDSGNQGDDEGLETPTDGSKQPAWITVPSSATKPDALGVDLHFDYQCPPCKLVEDEYGATFKQLSDSGDIVLRLHPRIFLDGALKNTSSTDAAVALTCVDVADPTKLAAYHDTVFANQPASEGTGYTTAQLRDQFTASVGLTGDALKSFRSCFDNQGTLVWVQTAEKNNLEPVPNPDGSPAYLFGGNQPVIDTDGQCGPSGAQVGVCATPSFFAGGVQIALADLLVQNADKSYSPKYTTPDALLTFLKQTAAS